MSEECIRVAVRIRPLLPHEIGGQQQVCVRVVPGSAQVEVNADRRFCFDYAFGPTATQDELYDACVRPLVESPIGGYNATVLCYGQTGSGKTYTLADQGGIIDRVACDVLSLLEEWRRKHSDGVEARVQVSYIELYKEELRDLLKKDTNPKELRIREDSKGNTVVVGAREIIITSAEELFKVREIGNCARHTGPTEMNESSSRSHAIFTLKVVQCSNNSSVKTTRSSKLCLVDLAGSEPARKTNFVGTRLKESAYINTGLLALGNVIRTLSERNRSGNNSKSTYVPYRDAKITRLLRDSLGGSTRTLIVVCISPSHYSVSETVKALNFASKANHIHNCPKKISAHREVKSCSATGDPSEVQELMCEVQTLRELLKERDRELEMQMERAGENEVEEEHSRQSGQIRRSEMNQADSSQYRLLTQDAADLLRDISGTTLTRSTRLRLRNWQERLKVVTDTGEDGDHPDDDTYVKLSKELIRCQGALSLNEQLLEQKDDELRRAQKDLEELRQEKNILHQALEEEEERNRIQSEQLVDQQMLIDQLRGKIATLQSTNSAATVEVVASGNSGKRAHSAPLTRHSQWHRSLRKTHSCPPAYSLERVMAAFKMNGHLLLAKLEEKDEVYCPIIKRQEESKKVGREKKEEEDDCESNKAFRCSLNQTWTIQRNWNPLIPESRQSTATKENNTRQSLAKKSRLSAHDAQRRIQDLSAIIGMKEDLKKELDKTDEAIKAADRHGNHAAGGGGDGVLKRLSAHSRQVRAEVCSSLQELRQQRQKLLAGLSEQRRTADSNEELGQSEEKWAGDSTMCQSSYQEDSDERPGYGSWLEKQEDRVLQKRKELQQLQEELRRREEYIQLRDACLQQKNNLESKKLRSQQALGRDLLRVSEQLENVEEHLRASRTANGIGGNISQELESERTMLKMERDSLDGQLKEKYSLLQLEDEIRALETAVEFQNGLIQKSQRKMSIADSSLHQSQSLEPAQLCGVIRKLKELSHPEATELLEKYFNKVVCLREAEHQLRLRLKELEIHGVEKEEELKSVEANMQWQVMQAHCRLTKQSIYYQKNIQLLLQKLQECNSGETEQVMQDRLQHLERELVFYKSSRRQLKQKLKELSGGTLHSGDQPSHKQEHKQTHNMPAHTGTNEYEMQTGKVQRTIQVATTYTKIHAEPTDQRTWNHPLRETQTPTSSLSSEPSYNQTQTNTQSQGEG